MKVGRALSLAAVCVLASGCFHQVVRTGRAPGTTVVSKPWTPFFLWGLASPTTIDVTQQCRSGIATVETQQSLPNGLVSLLTLGIYAPVDVKVTCASGSALKPGMTEFNVAGATSFEERSAILAAAIAEAQRTAQAVVVRF